MKIKALLFSLLFAFPVSMFAGILGTYTITGFDPQENLPYSGTVVITKAGHVYTAQWSYVGGGNATGTGVRKGDCLSFVFEENFGLSNSAIPFGVQQYKIEGETLSGPWVRFEETLRGTETITKVHP